MNQTQRISDLERIYRMAQQDGADFNLAYIGSDFNFAHDRKFDGEYMKRFVQVFSGETTHTLQGNLYSRCSTVLPTSRSMPR